MNLYKIYDLVLFLSNYESYSKVNPFGLFMVIKEIIINVNVVVIVFSMQRAQIIVLNLNIHPYRGKPIPAFRFHGGGVDAE